MRSSSCCILLIITSEKTGLRINGIFDRINNDIIGNKCVTCPVLSFLCFFLFTDFIFDWNWKCTVELCAMRVNAMVYWPIYRKSALQKFSLFFGQSSSRKIFFRKFENFGLTVSSFELPYHTARLSFKDFWPTDWKQKASQQDIMIIIWRPKFMVCIMNHHKIWPNNWRKNQKATHHQL
jgi:hypothetical protein